MRDKSLVAAFEAGKALPKPRQLGRLPTDELRVSLVNYCSTTLEDHEDEITELLLAGGLDDAGRAAFCSVTRKDCRGDAVAEAAKRQSIADILSGVNPCGNHHRVERFSSIDMELNPWLEGDSLIPIRFPIREVTQKATIGIRTLTKSLDRQIDDGLSGNQEGRDGGGSHHHQSQGCSHK